MNNFRTILDPSRLERGDIVQFSTAASVYTKRDRIKGPEGAKATHSYGYVLAEPVYQSQKNDRPLFEIFEILPLEHAQRLDRVFVHLNGDDVGNNLGINNTRQWAAVLEPITIDATPVALGRSDGMIQRVGNIAGSISENLLMERMAKVGDAGMRIEDSPGWARPGAEAWGFFAKGLGRPDNKFFKDDEFKPVDETKRKYQRKHAFQALAPDMDLADAVRTINFPEEIRQMVATAQGRKNPAITSLRDIWDLSKNNPSSLEVYIPDNAPAGISLAALLEENKIHPSIVNGLAKPRAGSGVGPIIDLKGAFDLVSSSEDPVKELQKYSYMGKHNSELAIEEIKALNEQFAPASKEEKVQSVAVAVKAAWMIFMDAYAQSVSTGTVPPEFQGQNGKPVWKMVPQKP